LGLAPNHPQWRLRRESNSEAWVIEPAEEAHVMHQMRTRDWSNEGHAGTSRRTIRAVRKRDHSAAFTI